MPQSLKDVILDNSFSQPQEYNVNKMLTVNIVVMPDFIDMWTSYWENGSLHSASA